MQRVYAEKQAIDLRIANPWPELEDFAMKFDLDNCDEYNHSHIPYVVFLIQSLKKYGKLPSKSSEEKEFLEVVKSMERFDKEENCEEARLYKQYAYKDTLNV